MIWITVPNIHQRGKQYGFELTDEEREMLKKLAEADGRTAASWMRAAIRKAFAALQETSR